MCTFRNSQGGTPCISQDITADETIVVDIRMIDPGRKRDTRRFEWIVFGEGDSDREDAAGIWCLALEVRYDSDVNNQQSSVRRTGPIICPSHWKGSLSVGSAMQPGGGSRRISINCCTLSQLIVSGFGRKKEREWYFLDRLQSHFL